MKSSFVFLLTLAALYCHAQTSQTPQKIGHADWEYIFNQMPEYKQMENEVKTFESQLQNQLKIKGQELEISIKLTKQCLETPRRLLKGIRNPN